MLCPDGNKDKGEELSEKEGDQDQLEKILNSKNIDVDRMLSEGTTTFLSGCTGSVRGDVDVDCMLSEGTTTFLSGCTGSVRGDVMLMWTACCLKVLPPFSLAVLAVSEVM